MLTTTTAGSTTVWEWTQEPDHLSSTRKHVASDLEIVQIGVGWKEEFQISETSDLFRQRVYTRLRQKLGRGSLDGLDTKGINMSIIHVDDS